MPERSLPALSASQSGPTYDQGLWLIQCDNLHEWVGAPDTDSFFACPVCGQDEETDGLREIPDDTPIGVVDA